ncbi:hypothetical protein GCM10027347_56080 [Larkinella harenae]
MITPVKKQSRLGSTLLVIGLLGLVLTSIFLSRRSLHAVQTTAASIYEDRLVPSGILLNLTATVYRKRLLLETYVLATQKTTVSQVSSMLDRLNRRADSLLTKYETTNLTEKEAGRLQLLKQRLASYSQLETEITTNLVDQPTEQQTLFTGRGRLAFSDVAQTLDELAALQLAVGEELINESRGQANYIYALTALQIGLVFVIGVSLLWYRF